MLAVPVAAHRPRRERRQVHQIYPSNPEQGRTRHGERGDVGEGVAADLDHLQTGQVVERELVRPVEAEGLALVAHLRDGRRPETQVLQRGQV